MKKNVIALLLSTILAAGSIGAAPVFAAEMTAEEAVTVEEEASEEIEDADTGLTAGDVSEEETIQAEEEEPAEEEREAEESTEEQSESVDITVPEDITDEEVEDAVVEGESYAEVTESEEPAVIEEETGSEEGKEAVQAGDVVDSGTCGDNATWTLTGTGDNLTLTISGSGEMESYYKESTPWYSKRSKIRTVVVGDGITDVGLNAFYSLNKLVNVSLPSTCSYIGGSAFENCVSLKKINFPDSLKEIAHYSFEDCSNSLEIHISSIEMWLNLQLDSWNQVTANLYLNGKAITSVTVPDGISSISSYAFNGCTTLKSVIIPDTVKSIGEFAFYGCKSLTSITIPNDVTSIEAGTFEGCSSLKSIKIPDSVTSIGYYAFYECSSLTSIAIPEGVTDLEYATFMDCSNLTSVILPNSITRIDSSVFRRCYSLKSISLPEELVSIGDFVFDECFTDFASVTITVPDSMTAIGYCAFGTGNDTRTGHQTKINIRFRGTKAQWNSAVNNAESDDNYVFYSSIIYNCFSVPATFKLSGTSFIYTGKAIKPSVTVTYKGKKLVEGTDYKLIYKNNDKPGIATANVTGIGIYSGTEPLEYRIMPGKTTRGDMFNLANNVKVTWNAVPGAKYYKVYREGITDDWETREEPVIVTSGLVGWDKDWKLTNGHAYRYKIVASFTGKDDPTGDSTLSYSKVMYRLKTVVIRSVKNTAPGKVTVTYDRTFSGDSYVLQWSEREDMVGAQSKVVLGAENTSYTIGGLKKGKIYYISIRVRKKVNGINYYTTFGVPKKVTVTK